MPLILHPDTAPNSSHRSDSQADAVSPAVRTKEGAATRHSEGAEWSYTVPRWAAEGVFCGAYNYGHRYCRHCRHRPMLAFTC